MSAGAGDTLPRSRTPLFALYLASGISLVGNQLTALALPWLVLTSLGGAVDAGLVGAAMVLPAVFGAVAGGLVVDRIGPRRTSVLADLTSALAVAAVPVAAMTVGLTVSLLVVLAFAGALLDAPGYTARQVLIPDLAARCGLPLDRANGHFQAIENASLLLGPALAGILVAALGPTNALWLDAGSFLVSAVLIRALVPSTRPVAGGEEITDIAAGLRTVVRDQVLRVLTFAAVIANLVGTPLFVVVLPVLAVGSMLGSAVLGWFLAAYGAGSVVGALAVGSLAARAPRARLLIVGFAGTGAALIAGSVGDSLLWLLGALFVAGLASGLINPIAFTVIQERVPAASRGRVIGAVLGAVLVAAPAGMLAAGWLVSWIDARSALVLAGIGFLLVALLLAVVRATRGVDDPPRRPAD